MKAIENSQPCTRRQFLTSVAVGAAGIAAMTTHAKMLEEVNIPSGSLAEHPAAKKDSAPHSFILSF